MKRPVETYFLFPLLFFLSVGAVFGGGSMILFPDGSLLQMGGGWIEMTPFSSFLIPGIILFIFLGILPLLALVGLFTRKNIRLPGFLNIFPEKHWGWTFSLYSGIICIIWIIVQQVMTEYYILQPVITATGLLIVIVSLLPRIQNFYSSIH